MPTLQYKQIIKMFPQVNEPSCHFQLSGELAVKAKRLLHHLLPVQRYEITLPLFLRLTAELMVTYLEFLYLETIVNDHQLFAEISSYSSLQPLSKASTFLTPSTIDVSHEIHGIYYILLVVKNQWEANEDTLSPFYEDRQVVARDMTKLMDQRNSWATKLQKIGVKDLNKTYKEDFSSITKNFKLSEDQRAEFISGCTNKQGVRLRSYEEFVAEKLQDLLRRIRQNEPNLEVKNESTNSQDSELELIRAENYSVDTLSQPIGWDHDEWPFEDSPFHFHHFQEK